MANGEAINSGKGLGSGKGLALAGLIIGLLTGAAAYGVIEYWIDDSDEAPLPVAALFFIVTASAAYLLLAERDRLAGAGIGAVAIAAFLFVPDFYLASKVAGQDHLSEFPLIAWFLIGRGLVAYLLIVLVKATLESGAPPRYAEVFFHGLTMPLIAGGAKLFAGLALVLLFVWARLLKELDVTFFNKLFQEPWFIFPFLGAVGGVSIAMMRGQQSVLGALRFVLLLLARILILITALFTITILLVLFAKGVGPVFDRPYASAQILALSLAGMLIFNGVYQNGESAPPPLWLRVPTIITLIGFPVYAGLGFAALGMRVDDYGLTPPRIAALAVTGLAAAYSLVCVAALASEINWRGKKWMPLVGSLNTVMAVFWIITFTAMATPVADPWAMSARSQYNMLAKQKIAADDFDFGFLRFNLGAHGEKTLDKLLALETHPEAGLIANEVARVRAAKSKWEYDNPDLVPTLPAPPAERPAPAGPETLEFNPEGGDAAIEDPADEQD
jgi:hypothetical protein